MRARLEPTCTLLREWVPHLLRFNMKKALTNKDVENKFKDVTIHIISLSPNHYQTIDIDSKTESTTSYKPTNQQAEELVVCV